MFNLREIPLAYAARNAIRRLGVEAVPARADSSLMGIHLKSLFSQMGISCVLDVGARGGDFGLWLRRNGYRESIISFEPVRASFQDLAQVSAGDEKWYCFNYALGADDESASINVTTHTQFSSFRPPNAQSSQLFGSSGAVQRSEEVEVHRLDTVLSSLPVGLTTGRTYLKLDTQGWDLEVLKGADRLLDYVGALQTEVAVQPIYENMPSMAQSLDAVTSLGFAPSGFFPVTLDPDLVLVEFDLVAVRRPDFGATQTGLRNSGGLSLDPAG